MGRTGPRAPRLNQLIVIGTLWLSGASRRARAPQQRHTAMGDALRSIRIATKDQSVLTTARAALSSAQSDGVLEGFEVQQVEAWRDLVEAPPAPGDVLVLDSWLKDGNVYEMLRHLAGRTKCRTYVLIEGENRVAEPIARFCGATGVIERPITRAKLQALLGESGGPRRARIRGPRRGDHEWAELHVPRDPSRGAHRERRKRRGDRLGPGRGRRDHGALIDPVTSLFNYSFLSPKLDEEFKRARRFRAARVRDARLRGQASDDTLRSSFDLLAASQDTDVLGRFDENSFCSCSNTGPDGAEIMAQRVANTADESRLLDLVEDRIELSIEIANPSPNIHRRKTSTRRRVRRSSRRVRPAAAWSSPPSDACQARCARPSARSTTSVTCWSLRSAGRDSTSAAPGARSRSRGFRPDRASVSRRGSPSRAGSAGSSPPVTEPPPN